MKSTVLLCLCGCTFNFGVEGEVSKNVDSDVMDSGVTDSGDTDSGDTEPLYMLEIANISSDSLDRAGYAVGAPIPGMFTMSSDGNDTVYGFATDSTLYRDVSMPPDPADFTYSDTIGNISAGMGTFTVQASGIMTEGFFCVGADYDSTYAPNGGKINCVRQSKVMIGAGLNESDSDVVFYGAMNNLYLGAEAFSADLNSDGKSDFIGGGGDPGTIVVEFGVWETVLAAPSGSTLTYVFPADADLSFVACDTDDDGVSNSSSFCAPRTASMSSILVTDSYNTAPAPIIETFALPLVAGVAPTRINQRRMATPTVPVGTIGVWTSYGWIVNDPGNDQFLRYDEDLSGSSAITMPRYGTAWGLATGVVDGAPWIAFGASDYSDNGMTVAANIGSRMIKDYMEADYVNVPGEGDSNNGCGYSLTFATTTDGEEALVAGCYKAGSMVKGAKEYVFRPAP